MNLGDGHALAEELAFENFRRLIPQMSHQQRGERLEQLGRHFYVVLPAATQEAAQAYAASGMLSAAQDYEQGGMQLPYTLGAAANAFFACSSVSYGPGMPTTCHLYTPPSPPD